MGLFGIGLLALVIWLLAKLLRMTRQHAFSTQAVVVSIIFAVVLIALSQKGWLVVALIPTAVVFSICLYCFWSLKDTNETSYRTVLRVFIMATVVLFFTIPGLGDGDDTLAFSIIPTTQNSVLTTATSVVAGVASISVAASFAWLYAKSLRTT